MGLLEKLFQRREFVYWPATPRDAVVLKAGDVRLCVGPRGAQAFRAYKASSPGSYERTLAIVQVLRNVHKTNEEMNRLLQDSIRWQGGTRTIPELVEEVRYEANAAARRKLMHSMLRIEAEAHARIESLRASEALLRTKEAFESALAEIGDDPVDFEWPLRDLLKEWSRQAGVYEGAEYDDDDDSDADAAP